MESDDQDLALSEVSTYRLIPPLINSSRELCYYDVNYVIMKLGCVNSMTNYCKYEPKRICHYFFHSNATFYTVLSRKCLVVNRHLF